MDKETLQITWKFIRRAGYGRTPKTYCSYIAENENHKHRLMTIENTELFEILKSTIISKTDRYEFKVLIDGMYSNGKLLYVTNFRKIYRTE